MSRMPMLHTSIIQEPWCESDILDMCLSEKFPENDHVKSTGTGIERYKIY